MALLGLLAVCLLATVCSTSGRGMDQNMRSDSGPQPNLYYHIISTDGHNLGVDHESYRTYLNTIKKRQANARHRDYPRVVQTAPTDGFFEQWAFAPYAGNPEKVHIIHKETGLYLTGWFDQGERAHRFSVRPKMGDVDDDSSAGQVFSIRIARRHASSSTLPLIQLVLDSENVALMSGGPLSDRMQVDAKGGRGNISHAHWRLKTVMCDPHPNQTYFIKHRLTNRFLALPESSSNSASTLLSETTANRDAATFKFIPISYDKKVYYIYHPRNGKVLDIKGRENKYGSPMVQNSKDDDELYQQFYILKMPNDMGCIVGSAASYRYMGVQNGAKRTDADGSPMTAVQKEQTPILDELWVFEPVGSSSRDRSVDDDD